SGGGSVRWYLCGRVLTSKRLRSRIRIEIRIPRAGYLRRSIRAAYFCALPTEALGCDLAAEDVGGARFCRTGAHKIAGGAVPRGAALCAPVVQSLPPPTPQGRGCRTSRPRPWCGVGVVAR